MSELPGLVPKFVISRSRSDRWATASVPAALVRAVANVASKRRRRALRYSTVLRDRPRRYLLCDAAAYGAAQYVSLSGGVNGAPASLDLMTFDEHDRQPSVPHRRPCKSGTVEGEPMAFVRFGNRLRNQRLKAPFYALKSAMKVPNLIDFACRGADS
jgi:hypothetical protein